MRRESALRRWIPRSSAGRQESRDWLADINACQTEADYQRISEEINQDQSLSKERKQELWDICLEAVDVIKAEAKAKQAAN